MQETEWLSSPESAGEVSEQPVSPPSSSVPSDLFHWGQEPE